MNIISWNVNGLRAVMKKGFSDFLVSEAPDIICLQEIKANQEDIDYILDSLKNIYPYITVNSAERKGYSGVAVLSKQEPISFSSGFGVEKFDIEGRVNVCEYDDFYLCNVYFPNGQRDKGRVNYKLEFYKDFFDYCDRELRVKKPVIVCGDFNTAHTEIDLARPKHNTDTSGFLLEERAWLDEVIKRGYIDSFRHFNNSGDNYTWWSYMFKAREKNVGWRIDYFFVDKTVMNRVQSSDILKDVMGSDHCPIRLLLK